MSAKVVTMVLLLYEITSASSSPSYGMVEPRRVLGGAGGGVGVGEAMFNKLATMQTKSTDRPGSSTVSQADEAIHKDATKLLPTTLVINNESSGINSFGNVTDNNVLWR
uniref:Uncharacterized protein n=1 Tax=Anopheles atroparvus TaxID=41427 RepID=A0AAG5D7Q5_ANOAO